MPIAAQHDQRREAVLSGPLGVAEAIRQRVFRGEKRNDAVQRDVGADVRNQMAKVVLFTGSDGVVGEEDVGALTRETANGMIGVNPRIDAG